MSNAVVSTVPFSVAMVQLVRKAPVLRSVNCTVVSKLELSAVEENSGTGAAIGSTCVCTKLSQPDALANIVVNVWIESATSTTVPLGSV